ncbi:MAG TPA: MarR family transcriptional regulator [Rhizobiales bacterium]|nr:transcriptional regulator SlyA [bacterium BMS3Bbin10]HDO51963.1 MarR family transcriptional regulator [Hyphomicrobiales bacterium]
MPASEERYLGFLISDAARLQRTIFDRRVRRLGFTRSQWLALRRLGRQPGASQSELAEMMEVEKATAGRVIDRLEENGWLERRPDENDRRIKRIYMTARGQAVHDTIGPLAEAMVEEELSGLTGAERKLLTDLMINVKRRLQEMAEENEPVEATGFELENA